MHWWIGMMQFRCELQVRLDIQKTQYRIVNQVFYGVMICTLDNKWTTKITVYENGREQETCS